MEIKPVPPPLFPDTPTFLNAEAGAISAPLNVLNRNMGQEDAFIRKPKKKINYNYKSLSLLRGIDTKYEAKLHQDQVLTSY